MYQGRISRKRSYHSRLICSRLICSLLIQRVFRACFLFYCKKKTVQVEIVQIFKCTVINSHPDHSLPPPPHPSIVLPQQGRLMLRSRCPRTFAFTLPIHPPGITTDPTHRHPISKQPPRHIRPNLNDTFDTLLLFTLHARHSCTW